MSGCATSSGLALGALRAHRLRSFLSMLGIAIGVAAVILLTSIGEGTRVYVLGAVHAVRHQHHRHQPRQVEDARASPASSAAPRASSRSTTPRRSRASPASRPWCRSSMGLARVEAGERGRSVSVLGVTPDLPALWKFGARQGSFWPKGDPRRGGAVAVLGPKLARELFGDGEPARRGRAHRGPALPRDRRDGAEGPDAGLRHRRHRDRARRERAAALQPGRAVRDRPRLHARRRDGARRGRGEARADAAARRGGLHRHDPGGDARRVRQRDGRDHDVGRARSPASRCWSARSAS